MKKLFLLSICISGYGSALFAQTLLPRMMKPKQPIICYADKVDQHTFVGAPEAFLKRQAGNARTKTATIEVTYIGFSTEARNAFQHAVDIWETLIDSEVPIRVQATWQPLGTGVLGSAIWGSVHANFPGAQRVNTWYPAALAEKMANQELNGASDPDIFANFNSTFNWYFNSSGTPSTGQYDFITIVLHELGHGLGFVDSYSVAGPVGTVGVQDTGLPIIYDQQLENVDGHNLYQEFSSGTAALKTQLTGQNVFYNSPHLSSTLGRARLYAPVSFDGGSSIAHLDETTYQAGSGNSLMTPQIGAVEVVHTPGPLALAVFADMGWEFTRIDHEPLKDTEDEDGPFTVTATITSDAGFVSDVRLIYTNGGIDTEISMSPTENSDEYEAVIPSTGDPAQYRYYIAVEDPQDRTFTSPGKLIEPGEEVQQFYHTFNTGPDTQAPRITHSAKAFVQDTETELLIEAIISDNIGLNETVLDYRVNGIDQPSIDMTQGDPDSLYFAEIPVAGLSIGDQIEYRILATDNAAAMNTSAVPATGFYTVNVVGLSPTADSYENDFNSPSDDFFGEGFTIATETGFDDGAIHSTHPYPEGTGFPNDELNLVYQLKIPIRVLDAGALIKFDEVVLVEPGEAGSVFGDEEFFDYVVVEGSLDGGVTWLAIDDGYDSRAHSDWLARYNSAITGNNSTATGTAQFFKPRVIDLLNTFSPGDEVAVRFRLFSDPFANGWGWAIDNLRIQVDDTPPMILHDHVDYVPVGEEQVPLTTNVSDASGLKELSIEFEVNNGGLQTFNFAVTPNISEYTLNMDLDGLAAGDEVRYRIVAKDSLDNTGALPASGFFVFEYLALREPVSEYVNDFNGPANDFVGNFFSVTPSSVFTNPGIHTVHPYPTGFGPDTTSDFTYTLAIPVVIDADNPFIRYDEVAIIEGHPTGSVFGDALFSDFVVVEGSDDGGQTWKPFADGYDAAADPAWQQAMNVNIAGNANLLRDRLINMTATGDFQPGDEVLIRFRLHSDGQTTGWGWVFDNLSIQGPVTGLENPSAPVFTVFPNPVQKFLNIRWEDARVTAIHLEIYNAQGKLVYIQSQFTGQEDVGHLPQGMYFARAAVNGKTAVRKFVKIN